MQCYVFCILQGYDYAQNGVNLSTVGKVAVYESASIVLDNSITVESLSLPEKPIIYTKNPLICLFVLMFMILLSIILKSIFIIT